MSASYDLARFVAAQEPVYSSVVDELRHGEKKSHWMWFVFPQIAGLGKSDMAAHYAIRSLDEARAYLEHPVLGQHLRECTALVLAIKDRSIEDIFGFPDNLKFHSSMTLFAHAAPEGDTLFRSALERFFENEEDDLTLTRIAP